ncbi:MAG: 3-phosphoshikimate 1-carboxyvinyltransferase, partial [Aquificota bacterium]
RVSYAGKLKAVEVKPEEVPSLIDELPVLAVVMALAEGVSRVRGAQELRVKESDRKRAIVENLRAMGVRVEEYEDGYDIEGTDLLRGAFIRTYKDHRIAMAFSVAGLVAEGETTIDNPDCVAVSYPDFYKHLFELIL